MKIIHANVITDGQIYYDHSIEIKNNKIISVYPSSEDASYEHLSVISFAVLEKLYFENGSMDLEDTVLDMNHRHYVCPGFIDIHNHGAMMSDIMDGTKEALDVIAQFHIKNGVTTFLPTTMTASFESYIKIFDMLDSFKSSVPVTIPGLHMEGPFLSKASAGAQPTDFLLKPDDENMAFFDRYCQHIKYMTISPDVPDICRLLDYCYTHNIITSGGHDNAIDTEIYDAINHHLKCVTHIYCCSSTISRRNSPQKHLGITEIGLLSPHLFCEVIADNCHIPPELFMLIYKCKGFKKICLISDSIRATGLKPGQYYLGNEIDGTLVDVTEQVALLPGKNLFAGSITPISKMVHMLIKHLHLPIEETVYMASTAPATMLNLANKGVIKENCDAELNILTNEGQHIATLVHNDYQNFNSIGGLI